MAIQTRSDHLLRYTGESPAQILKRAAESNPGLLPIAG